MSIGAKTIGLCMIVRNEAPVLLRCLSSVRPLIDHALIVDTGSTDGTQAIAKQYLLQQRLSGDVIDEPWQDFAYNRSFALAKLREHAGIDYAFILDADDTLVLEQGFDPSAFKAALDADLYTVEIRIGPLRLWRAQILNNRVEFGYKGVLHEFLAAPQAVSPAGMAAGLHIEAGNDGARSRNPNKHRDDANLLEAALQAETDEFVRARYVFYLAESWRIAGEKEKALQLYLRRATLGQFQPEVFLSLYHAAQVKEALGHHASDVIGSYLGAYEADPARAEPLHDAMDYCRRHNKHHQAYMIGKHAITIPQPASALFVAPRIYEYGVLEQFSIAAYHSGHYQYCIQAIRKLLDDGKIPQEAHERLRRNSELAAEKLAGTPGAATAGQNTSP